MPFICVFKFLSSMFCIFQCTGLSSLWLNVFLAFNLFWCYVSWIVFLISFSDSLLLVCRNVAGFYIVILYPTTLQNLFISSSRFLVASLVFSVWKIMLSAETILLLHFWMPFIFFSCLIALTRISSSMLNRSDENGHPCLVPYLREKVFHFSLLSMLAMSCHMWTLL